MKVKQYGGRFLEKGKDGQWREMEDRVARKKASQGKRFFCPAFLFVVEYGWAMRTERHPNDPFGRLLILFVSALREDKWE